ncbi:methyltransferase type 11 [bacterium SCGC AG-212-C10]|nr:methyltransferase type 11 [bacterium SCGC AG-212-C10]
MPDAIFDHPRLAAIYDAFDGPRDDLDHYLAIVRELNAKSVLDVGCGTGCFACLLSEHGYDVVGVDPAAASLDVARRKGTRQPVEWILGDATRLPPLAVDLAVMTGNVAQVFVDDSEWMATLAGIRKALRDGGHLVFEVRDPAKEAWKSWTRENTYRRLELPHVGAVEGWTDLTDVSAELVSFRHTYVFADDGAVLHSDSTLRFLTRERIEETLRQSGYSVTDVRGAPDRPGLEFVFITRAG